MFHPDQTELLISQITADSIDSPYWSVPVPAGSPRRLGEVMGRDAIWAPDARLIFQKGKDFWLGDRAWQRQDQIDLVRREESAMDARESGSACGRLRGVVT
jgi:hypothetical protein